MYTTLPCTTLYMPYMPPYSTPGTPTLHVRTVLVSGAPTAVTRGGVPGLQPEINNEERGLCAPKSPKSVIPVMLFCAELLRSSRHKVLKDWIATGYHIPGYIGDSLGFRVHSAQRCLHSPKDGTPCAPLCAPIVHPSAQHSSL